MNAGNKANTYINFKFAGTDNDWCYLWQIGGVNAYKLAFDFHDDDNDAILKEFFHQVKTQI